MFSLSGTEYSVQLFSLSKTRAISADRRGGSTLRMQSVMGLISFGYSDIWFPVFVVRARCPLSVNPLVLIKVQSFDVTHESNEKFNDICR